MKKYQINLNQGYSTNNWPAFLKKNQNQKKKSRDMTTKRNSWSWMGSWTRNKNKATFFVVVTGGISESIDKI